MPYPQLQPLSFDQQFTATDWLEMVGTSTPAGDDTFTETGSDAVLVGIIDAKRAIGAIRFFNGYATCDQAAPYKLHRYPPPQHPRYPWLHSTGVALKLVGPRGNTDNENNQPWIEAADPNGLLDKVANYEKAYATVRFSQLPFPLLTDDELESQGAPFNTELDRYCTVYETAQPSFDVLQADGGVAALKFAQGSATPDPVLPQIGSSFPAPIGVNQVKNAYSIRWWRVPDGYLFGSNYDPPKISVALGRVNSASFLGFNPGELLFTGAQLTRYTPPLWVFDPPAVFWDVVYQFTAFKPDLGEPSGGFYGHNCLPWRGNGKYYYCTRDGLTSGEPFIQSYDFARLFEHADKP